MRRLVTPLFLLLTLGLSGACATGSQATAAASRTSRGSPITMEEIGQAGMANAYDLVQALRPAWLRKQGQQTATTPDEIIVYLDDTSMGGLPALRQISTGNIRSVEFVDARTAQFRWGSGHAQGVILVTTRK